MQWMDYERFRLGEWVINGLGAPLEEGKRTIIRAKAFGKNGTSGHRYGTPIGLIETKYINVNNKAMKNPLLPNATVANKTTFLKSLAATLNSYDGNEKVRIADTAVYNTTSGINNPTSIAICPITIAATKPIAVESGVGV